MSFDKIAPRDSKGTCNNAIAQVFIYVVVTALLSWKWPLNGNAVSGSVGYDPRLDITRLDNPTTVVLNILLVLNYQIIVYVFPANTFSMGEFHK